MCFAMGASRGDNVKKIQRNLYREATLIEITIRLNWKALRWMLTAPIFAVLAGTLVRLVRK
jgi:hypothetical protein